MNHNHHPNPEKISKSVRVAMSKRLYIRGVFLRTSFDEDRSKECITVDNHDAGASCVNGRRIRYGYRPTLHAMANLIARIAL